MYWTPVGQETLKIVLNLQNFSKFIFLSATFRPAIAQKSVLNEAVEVDMEAVVAAADLVVEVAAAEVAAVVAIVSATSAMVIHFYDYVWFYLRLITYDGLI